VDTAKGKGKEKKKLKKEEGEAEKYIMYSTHSKTNYKFNQTKSY
jgi:hypothetical protein